MHSPPRLPFSHPATPPPLKKGKLKLTFHLPHKYFWQALLAFRLPSPGETGSAESLHLRLFLASARGTRGTTVAWAGPIPATVQGQEVAQL